MDTTTDTHHNARDLVAAVVRALEVIAGASETGAFRKSSDTGHASSGAKPGTRTIALPLEPAVRARPWVLKMHGDADHPGSIVLTRHDYMRFDRDSGPSAAVVQSRMLTGHLIFVGYLMTDENVIRLAREVQRFREAYEGGEVGPGTAREGVGEVVGTVIGAFPPGLREDLWRGTLRFTRVAEQVLDLLESWGWRPPAGGRKPQ